MKTLTVILLTLMFAIPGFAKNKDKVYQTGSLSVTVSDQSYQVGWYDNTYCYGNFCGGDITPVTASDKYYEYRLTTEDGTLYNMEETGLRGRIVGNSTPHFSDVKPGAAAVAIDYRIEKKQDHLFVFIKTTKGEAKFELLFLADPESPLPPAVIPTPVNPTVPPAPPAR